MLSLRGCYQGWTCVRDKSGAAESVEMNIENDNLVNTELYFSKKKERKQNVHVVDIIDK